MSEQPQPQPFNCEPCKFSANTPLEWQRHTELASHIKKTGGTPRDKSVKYKCPYCSKEYAFMSKLFVHMNEACKKKPSPVEETKEEDTPTEKKCNCEKCASGETDQADLETMVNRFIDRKRMIYPDDEKFHSQVYEMEMYDPTSPPVPDTGKINYNAPMPDIEPFMRLIKQSRKMRKYLFSIIYTLLEEDFRQSKVVEEVRGYAEKRGFDVFTKDDFHLHVEDRNKIYLRSMKGRDEEEGSDIPAYSKVMEKN